MVEPVFDVHLRNMTPRPHATAVVDASRREFSMISYRSLPNSSKYRCPRHPIFHFASVEQDGSSTYSRSFSYFMFLRLILSS